MKIGRIHSRWTIREVWIFLSYVISIAIKAAMWTLLDVVSKTTRILSVVLRGHFLFQRYFSVHSHKLVLIKEVAPKILILDITVVFLPN